MTNYDEMIKLFEGLYPEDCQADEVKKGIREDLKDWAKNNEVSVKSLNAAYKQFKNYASGKLLISEIEESSELTAAIDSYFAGK